MKRQVAIIILIVIYILFGCSLAGPSNNSAISQKSEILIESPYNVQVEKDKNSNAIVLTWEDFNFGNHYEVERSVEGGEFILLTEKPIAIRHYRDTSYPPDKLITYRVRAVSGDLFSEFTLPLFSIVIFLEEISVQHPYATKLEAQSAIRISWTPLDNMEITPSYSIRRYDSRESAENTPDTGFTEFIPNSEDLSTTIDGKLCYIDKTITEHLPYFYSVHWTNLQNGQIGLPSKIVLGMASEYDYCDSEPNNSLDDFEISKTYLPLPDQKLIIYDFVHPQDKDVDWYNYVGDPCNLEVSIFLEKGFNLAGNLEFSFFHNGKTYPCGTINNANAINVFEFPIQNFEDNSVIKEPNIVSANKILNGDFYTGTYNWDLISHENGNASMNNYHNELNIIVNNGGSIEWHVQVIQNRILLEQGKSYLVEFDARSQFPGRIIQTSMGKSSGDYITYSGYEFVSLKPIFQHYSYSFTMTNSNDSNARMEFNLGLSNVDVFLDNIRLYEIEQQDVEVNPSVQFCIKPAQTDKNIYGMYRLSIKQK